MLVLILAVLAVTGLIYLLPAIIAFRRAHPSRWLIAAFNLMTGLTGLGWYLALREALKPLPQVENAPPVAAGLRQAEMPIPLPSRPAVRPQQHQQSNRRTKMGFFASIGSCFGKYATFSGRASRSEFWWFFLFCCLVSAPGAILGPFVALVALPLALPSLAVGVRRLHDLDTSGWWILAYPIPIIGLFLFIIWNCRKGAAGENRFGANPLGESSGPAGYTQPLSATSMTDKAEQLAKIKNLLEAGTVNQEEFDRMKAEVLAS
jgi:uncharacterized membrane protein YhaH (DUF805 family)